MILFVLTDAILLKLDLQKKDIGFGQSSKWKVVCLAKIQHISKNWERIFDFQYKVVTGQCGTKTLKDSTHWDFFFKFISIHYQDVFKVEMGVKISGIYHRIQIYWFGARPFSLGGPRMEKPCKNGVF